MRLGFAILTLFAAQFALAQQLPPQALPPTLPGQISGRVLHSLSAFPIARVDLALVPVTPGLNRAFASTDAAGAFRFTAVPPGDYTLEATRNGFLTMSYGARSPSAAPAVIHLGPGQTRQLDFSLVPQSVLAVKVFNEFGEPLHRAAVQVFARRFVNARLRPVAVMQGQTNDLGEFRATSLPAGSYYVAATPPAAVQPAVARAQGLVNDNAPGPTFFPSAADFSSAVPIRVGASAETPVSITIAAATTYRIRGSFPPELLAAANTSLLLVPADDSPTLNHPAAALSPDGTFELSGVAPGNYVVGLTGSVAGLAPRLLARAGVTVTQSDAESVALQPVDLITLRGRVLLDGSPFTTPTNRPANLAITLAALDQFPGTLAQRQIAVEPDGTFTVPNLVQGRYRLLPAFAIGGAYLSAIRLGDADVTNTPIDLTTMAAPPALDLVFRPGAVLLEVIVDRPFDVDPGTVIVVPDPFIAPSVFLPANGPIVLTPEESGFTVARNLPPGSYRAYAFELFEPSNGIDPALLKTLESKSGTLTLTQGQAGRVAVPRITSAEAAAQ